MAVRRGFVPAHCGYRPVLLAGRVGAALPGRRSRASGIVAEEGHCRGPVERLKLAHEGLGPAPFLIAARVDKRLELRVRDLVSVDVVVGCGNGLVVVEARQRESQTCRRKRNSDHVRRMTARVGSATTAAKPGSITVPVARTISIGSYPAFSKRHQNHSRQPRVHERSPTDWMPRGVAADEPQRHVGAGRRRRNRDLTRDPGPHAVQMDRPNASLRLRRQEKRFTVAVEVGEPEDLGQCHVRAQRVPLDCHIHSATPAATTTTAPARAPIAQGRRAGHDRGRDLQADACTHASSAWTNSRRSRTAVTGLVERPLDHAPDVVGHVRDARQRRVRPVDNRLQELVVVRAWNGRRRAIIS